MIVDANPLAAARHVDASPVVQIHQLLQATDRLDRRTTAESADPWEGVDEQRQSGGMTGDREREMKNAIARER